MAAQSSLPFAIPPREYADRKPAGYVNPFFETAQAAAASAAPPNPFAQNRGTPVTGTRDFRDMVDMLPRKKSEDERAEEIRRAGMGDVRRHKLTGGYKTDPDLVAAREQRIQGVYERQAAEDALRAGGITDAYAQAARARADAQRLDSAEYLGGMNTRGELLNSAIVGGGYAYKDDRANELEAPGRALQLRAMYGDEAFTDPLTGKLGGEIEFSRNQRDAELGRAAAERQRAAMIQAGVSEQDAIGMTAMPEEREALRMAAEQRMRQGMREKAGLPEGAPLPRPVRTVTKRNLFGQLEYFVVDEDGREWPVPAGTMQGDPSMLPQELQPGYTPRKTWDLRHALSGPTYDPAAPGATSGFGPRERIFGSFEWPFGPK